MKKTNITIEIEFENRLRKLELTPLDTKQNEFSEKQKIIPGVIIKILETANATQKLNVKMHETLAEKERAD